MSAFSGFYLATRATRRPVAILCSVMIPLLLSLPLLLGGCGGGGSQDEVVIARVGDHEITKSYYEERLSKLKQNELPVDELGRPISTATPEGKEAFLKVIISKEVMVQKAFDLGFDKDESIANAYEAALEFNATSMLNSDLVDVPASTISDEELLDYYSNWQKQRICSFLITNFREEALAAREELDAGALWRDVAEKYHQGNKDPKGLYSITIPWGRYQDDFEDAIFSLEKGEITQPVQTVYGFWLLRVDKIESVTVPPLDSIKDRVLNSIRVRKINLTRMKFQAERHQKYQFELNEDVLYHVFQGLPAKEDILDPLTKQPVPRDQLEPLEVDRTRLDELLYQYMFGGKLKKITLGDYKNSFDQMNVFQRPKKHELLGGLRQKIIANVDRSLILQDSKDRGYPEDPRVIEEARKVREEMMVTKLHTEVVGYDANVTSQEITDFWAEHSEEYFIPEGRRGLAVYCENLDKAHAALTEARSGADWEDILEQFGSDESNKGRGGDTSVLRISVGHSISDALFALEKVGDISEPVSFREFFAIVKLHEIVPGRQPDLDESREPVSKRIQARRQDNALRKLLDEWQQQFPVKIETSRLGELRSWEELTGATPTAPLT